MKNFIKSYKYKIIFIQFASVIIAVVFALFSVDGATNSKNLEFISSYGWEVDSSPADISHITVPKEPNGIYLTYAGISAVNNTSLTDYCGESLTRYSYRVLNHSRSDGGKIRANIFVHDSQIVAADISDISKDGSTKPISDINDITSN